LIGWQAIVASGCYLCATLIQGLIVLGNPHYVSESWHTLLIYWAAVAFAIFVNTLGSRLLPKIESLILILHTVGFFAILIPLIYFAPHGNAEEVFTKFINSGGWSSNGLSFMIGCVGQVLLGKTNSRVRVSCHSLTTELGADSAVHVGLNRL
jgi:choline transport protein